MKTRYMGLDILKLICSFFVVYIHTCSDNLFDTYILALTRIAVPVFFMITGFFFQGTINKGREIIQIKKILKYILISNLLYLLFLIGTETAKFLLTGNWSYITDKLYSIFSISSVLDFLLFNESPFASHLWYLNAIFYVLVIAFLFRKLGIFRIFYFLTPLLLIADLIFGKYSIALFGHEFNILYVRNFLCVGLPYFMIGNAIYKFKTKILNIFSAKSSILLTSLFVMLCLLEKYIILYYNINATRDHYIMTTPLACCIFVLFMQMPDTKIHFLNQLGATGKNYSLIIYIIHPIVIFIMSIIQKILSLTEPLFQIHISPEISFNLVSSISSRFLSVIVFLFSLLISIAFKKAYDKLKQNSIKGGA